jgi:Secretion system C-terminal sorting domain
LDPGDNCVATGVYTGSLDDIIAYGNALTSAQVTQLYNYSNTTSLPLDWLSFSAQAAGSGVYLQWSTDHSVDNNFFDIERSTDGTNFSVIGQISSLDSGDNAIGAAAYNYTDVNPPQGNVFYRIMEVDKDGQESWSSISEVTIGKGLAGIHLQNNPVTDEVTVINNGQILLQRIQVLDVSGRVLIDQAPYSSNSVLQLGTSSLPSGYYLLRVSASGTNTTIPFVKL